jgi:hypothetical protein
MIQRCEDLGLTLEARHPIRIGREGFRQHLQRDVAIELRIARAIYLAMPPTPIRAAIS